MPIYGVGSFGSAMESVTQECGFTINCHTHTRARDARARRQKQPSRLRGRTLVCLGYHPAHPHRANNPRGGGSHPTPTRSRHAIATRSSVRACGSRPNPSRSRHAIATRSLVSRQGSKVHHRSQNPWNLPHARGFSFLCLRCAENVPPP